MIKIRMCVCCRKRLHQDSLVRLQFRDGVLSTYTMIGRSFYLCDSCLMQNKTTSRICKIFKINDDENVVKFFKEIAYKWQKNKHQK